MIGRAERAMLLMVLMCLGASCSAAGQDSSESFVPTAPDAVTVSSAEFKDAVRGWVREAQNRATENWTKCCPWMIDTIDAHTSMRLILDILHKRGTAVPEHKSSYGVPNWRADERLIAASKDNVLLLTEPGFNRDAIQVVTVLRDGEVVSMIGQHTVPMLLHSSNVDSDAGLWVRDAGELEDTTGLTHCQVGIEECSESGEVHSGHPAEICDNATDTGPTVPPHGRLEHPGCLVASDRAVEIQNNRVAALPFGDSHDSAPFSFDLGNHQHLSNDSWAAERTSCGRHRKHPQKCERQRSRRERNCEWTLHARMSGHRSRPIPGGFLTYAAARATSSTATNLLCSR